MQVYGAILPGAGTVDRLLPRAARAARAEPILSRQARQRLKMLRWYEERGRNASRTCRHFGVSRDTFYRWLRRYERQGAGALEDRSHRPQRVRQPTWSPELAQAVRQLREAHPRWGKDKLAILLRAAGWQVSVSMVGRILTQLKEGGVLWETDLRDPCILRRSQVRPYAVRKPRDYQVAAPGDLVQVDTADLRPLPGVVYKHFTARDVVCRWDILDVSHRATAQAAATFLQALERLPFPVRAIQVDGGSEFKADFERACQERGIRLFVLPPRSPKLNGSVERAQRTHKEEFYQVVDLPETIGELRQKLRAWEAVYNTVRPHQALGQQTPAEYCRRWLNTTSVERG